MELIKSHLKLVRIADKGQILNLVGLVGQFPVKGDARPRQHLDQVRRFPEMHQQAIHQAQEGDHAECGRDFTGQISPAIYLP